KGEIYHRIKRYSYNADLMIIKLTVMNIADTKKIDPGRKI
ncbi:unnamed protein product, partial [marine sediment metagenome]